MRRRQSNGTLSMQAIRASPSSNLIKNFSSCSLGHVVKPALFGMNKV